MSKDIESVQGLNISNRAGESNTSAYISEMDLFEYECTSCERIWRWGYPTLLALGLLGNALYLVAFSAHKLRRETRVMYTLLALFDSLSLLSAFTSRWPDAAFGISPINIHPILCHVFIVANYWLPDLAAWTLVLMSIERSISGDNSCCYTLCSYTVNNVSKFTS